MSGEDKKCDIPAQQATATSNVKKHKRLIEAQQGK
jgi:hypothetical protein